MEIMNEWLSVDHHATGSCFHICNGLARFAFTETPRSTLAVKLWLTFLLGKGPSEVKEVDPVVARELVGLVWCGGHAHDVARVDFFSKFAQMGPHVMPVEGVLAHRVEQRNLLQLVLSEASNRVVSHGVVVFDFCNDFFGGESFHRGFLINL